MNNDQARGKVLARKKPKAKPAQKAPYGVAAPKPTGVFAAKGTPKPILKSKKTTAKQKANAETIHRTATAQVKSDDDKPVDDAIVNKDGSQSPGPISTAQAKMVVANPKKYRNSALVAHLKAQKLVDTMHGYPIRGDALVADTANHSVAVKLLEQTTRPLHAVAGATDAALHGENVPRALSRGIQNKDKKTFSDVLKRAGAPKGVAAVGGFVADWYLDPVSHGRVTRVTPKAAAEARAAQHEASSARAETKARAAGTTAGSKVRENQAGRHAKKAAKFRDKAAAASDDARGFQAGFDVKVPFGPRFTKMSSGKGTARVGGKVRPGAEKVHGSRVSQTAEAMFHPTARKEGETVAERDARVYAERQQRARTAEAGRLAERRATAYARNSKGVDEGQVVAAVEKAAKTPLTATKQVKRKAGVHKAVVAATRVVRVAEVKLAKERGRAQVLRDQARREGVLYKPPARLAAAETNLKTARANLAAAKDAAVGVPKHESLLVDAKTGQRYEDFKATAPAHSTDQLPPKAENVATAVEGELAALKTEQKTAGVLDGERPNYFPHDIISDGKGGVLRRKGSGAKPSHAKTRKDPRPLLEQDAERAAKGSPPVFSTDVPRVMGRYVGRAKTAIASSQFLGDLKTIYKPLSASTWAKRRPTDGLYEITPTGIKALRKPNGKDLDESEVQKLIADGADVTVMPRDVGDNVVAGRQPGHNQKTKAALKVLNKPMQVFKTGATVLNVPFYQIRNFMDDSWRSWAGDMTTKAFVNSVRLVKDMSFAERREATQLTPTKIQGDMMVGGKMVPRQTVAEWARADGIVGTSYSAGDDMLRGLKGPAVGVRRIRPINKLREYSQHGENAPKVGNWLAALDRGMSRREAANHVRIYNFDYDELTDIERAIRGTLVPFYTYMKKNTSLMGRLMVSRPGKLSAIEKLREEANKYGTDSDAYRKAVAELMPQLEEARKAGLVSAGEIDALRRGHFEALLNEVDQRGVPILGPNGNLMYMPIGITDLNRIPLATSWEELKKLPGNQFDMAMSMLGPQKLPIELGQNYSFFFRDAIYRDAKNPDAERWVPAPGWAKGVGIPTVKREVDGKTQDAWPAWVDYTIRAMGPQWGMAANIGNPTKNARGQSTADMLKKQLTGVRFAHLDDRILAGIQFRAAKELGRVQVAIADAGDPAGQAGKLDPAHPHFYSVGYQRLLDRQRQLQGLLSSLKSARTGAPKPDPSRLQRRPENIVDQIRKQIQSEIKSNTPDAIREQIARQREKIELQSQAP